MRPYPSTIGGAMAVVAVIAANLAAARALDGRNREILVGIALAAVALQAAAVLTLRGHDQRRAFFIAFIVGGLAMMASFAWAMLHPTNYGIRRGTLITTPGSPLYDAWIGYARFASEYAVMPLISLLGVDPEAAKTSLLATRAVIWSIPQLAIAFIFGLIAARIGKARPPSEIAGPHPTAANRPSPA